MTGSELKHFIFHYLGDPERKLNYTFDPGYISGRVYNFMMKANSGNLELLSKIAVDLALQNGDYVAKNPDKVPGVGFLTMEDGTYRTISENLFKYVGDYDISVDANVNDVYTYECKYNDQSSFKDYIAKVGTEMYVKDNAEMYALVLNDCYKFDVQEISDVAKFYNIPIIMTHQVSDLNNTHIKETEFMIGARRDYIDKLVGKDFSSCVESVGVIV